MAHGDALLCFGHIFQWQGAGVCGWGWGVLFCIATVLVFKGVFFSSPEHEVLMVSYWDSAVSGVRRPSCVVRRPSSTFYLVYALEATVLVGYSWKLVRMFVSMKSRTSSKMGHVGSKTRSLGQILEKPCVRSRGHILSRILMEVGQDVCLDDISDEFENGSRGVKN